MEFTKYSGKTRDRPFGSCEMLFSTSIIDVDCTMMVDDGRNVAVK